jgi:hypothetical protein
MPRSEIDSTTATAHLPGLDIEIVHHHSPDGLTEQVSINLTATPSFEAFARSIDAWNPFAFWAEAMRTPGLLPSLPKARPEPPGPPPRPYLIRETD